MTKWMIELPILQGGINSELLILKKQFWQSLVQLIYSLLQVSVFTRLPLFGIVLYADDAGQIIADRCLSHQMDDSNIHPYVVI